MTLDDRDVRTGLSCTGMRGPCDKSVTHIDRKGFVYCAECGARRKTTGLACRQLRKGEKSRLERGGTIRY